MTNITITGSGLALPVARDPQLLVDIILSASPDDAPCVDVDPIAWLGKRKGLRYKDRATQLAYCAASDALKSAGLLIEDGLTVDACDIAVVGTSNFGNLDTVTSTIDILSAEDTTSTSPMDLPNASSNVLASSVAVRYGLKGPNLMLCNGATSGTDALMVASTLLRAQRARHVVVVGAEPDNKPIQRLISGRGANAGAAIVMETSDIAIDRGARMQAQLERVTPSIGVDSWQGLSHADETVVIGGPLTTSDDSTFTVTLPRAWGDMSGMLGVLQAVLAGALLERRPTARVLTHTGDSTATVGASFVAP